MKLILLSLLFLPIIYLALRQKKWYLYLFLALHCVLPEQFSVRLHASLPLITGSRLLIVCVFGFWLRDRWKTRQLILPKSILIFLGINLVISFVNFRFGFSEINRIFLLLFERVLPIIMLADMIETREEFDRGVDFLILGAVALAIIGISQALFEYDISTPLHLTKTYTSGSLTPRMGMTRAAGTYNAISFGCYCALITIGILYRLYNTKKLLYAIAFTLVAIAMILTLSRSAWLCLLAILFVMTIFTRGRLILRLLPTVGTVVALILILSLVHPTVKNAFVETGKSALNTVLDFLPDRFSSAVVEMLSPADEPETPTTTPEASVDPSETEPPSNRFELDENFGLNGEDPSYTRMAQWTAIRYMANTNNLMFGMGYNALPEGRIHFFFDRWDVEWESADFLDVGLIALVAEGGLIGAASFLLLLGYLFVRAFQKRDRKNPMDFCHVILYLIPLFLILNFAAAFMFEDLVWVMLGLIYAWQRINSQPEADRDLWVLSLEKRSSVETAPTTEETK